MVLEGRSPQQDDVPLLSEEAKAHNRHLNKKRKPRRRSMFQNSDDHHELLASEQDLIGLDIDKVDSWGVLHDTEDDSIPLSSDLRESLEMDPSYIDHRPSIAIMQTATSMHNGAHVGSISSPRRPSTVPRNSASRVSSAEGGKKHPTATNYKFRDPFKSCTVDERLKLRKPYSSKTGQRSSFDRWSTERGYGSVPLYTHSTSRELGIHGSRGDVVIDVDRLMEHVKLQREQGQQESSDAPSEEYNSQPSSRRSSGSSSLDDVCLPIEEGDAEGLKQWPDVSVLEEFSKQEIEKLKREALQDAEDFHFQYDNEEDDDTTESASGIAFLKPIITNIDVPELGNTRVNETEQLRKGRLRPKKITPWHLKKGGINLPGLSTSGKHRPKEWYADMAKEDFLAGCNIQYPPHIISNNPEVFRFTYFREDLDSTIHSPTISGLLQPGQKFDELFVGSVYSSAGGRSSSNNNLTLNANHEAQTPLDTNPSSPAQKASTTHQSGSWDMTNVSPFWLDVLNPTEEEMKVLSKTFGIHPLTTEDIFLGEVREKVELFKDYYLVCFRSFDIVAERSSRKKKKMQQQESVHSGAEESGDGDDVKSGWVSRLKKFRRRSSTIKNPGSNTSSYQRKARRKVQVDEKYKKKSGDRRKPRDGELEPLNVYILVFRTGVLTFHFAPTPHPINVRRRARLLKDYLNVTADWIAYALIDDITDAFAPMIELIEDEVYDIEDSILKMHHSESSSDSSGSDLDGESSEDDTNFPFDRFSRRTTLTHGSRSTTTSRSSSTTDSTINANIMGWKKKGDMLRRIGECRKRVMSIVRLLGSKADVIKGFSKRCNEQWEVAPRSEIGMYLGDIQDHIITMVSSLNHYEKLLSRSHSNYLAQINIDMTKVSNDMNDVLGKITILGTIVMPMNIITGLWGMNVIVPGQFNESLLWFFCIALSMVVLAYIAYTYTRKKFGI